jgi:hypothetical protein
MIGQIEDKGEEVSSFPSQADLADRAQAAANAGR